MIVNGSQSIQSSNPLDTSSSRRVNDVSRPSSSDPEDKTAIEAQKKQDDSVLRQLRSRDREVRAHEAAHVAAGGSLVRGGPSFTYQTGPDGRTYAIGGEVQLDVSAVANDPAATLAKAGKVRSAALAPADPSPQDLRVAANANQLASRARVDLAIQRREEAQLEQNQKVVADATVESEEERGVDSSVNTRIENVAPPVNANSANLQSNEPPAAALSAFMATAQTSSEPVLISQFI